MTVFVAGLVAWRVWPDQIWAYAGSAARAERDMGAAGWLLAAVVQTLIALCGILPASVGAFAMGMAYGIVGGFVVSATATISGALLAFLLARSLLRPGIARVFARNPRLAKLDEAVSRDGWRLVVLMRLSPIMPFAMTSYALGLTSLGLRPYGVGTLAALPALMGYVTMGHLARTGYTDFANGRSGAWHWLVLGTTIVVTMMLTWRLAKILRSVMRLPDPGFGSS